MDDYSSPAQPDRKLARRTLGEQLSKRFDVYKTERSGAERQWMENLRQFLGKYDPEREQTIEKGRSRAYPKRTRVKCVSMVSRLMSLLFPAGEKNWRLTASPVPNLPADTLVEALQRWQQENPDAQPTQETLDRLVHSTAKEIARLQETIIDDQLQDVSAAGACDYETLVRKVVFSGVLYGPGVIKGPLVQRETATQYRLTNGVPQVVEVEAFRPYLEFVPCWNYYPDMSAPEFEQMEGEFQRHIYSRHQLLQLAKRPDFDGEAIREFVRQHPEGNYERSSHENEMQSIGGQGTNTAVGAKGKYELLEYWGSCRASELREAGADDLDEADTGEEDVRFTAWLLGRQIIKLAKNPMPEGTKVFHQFVFEEDEVNLLGSGLPPIMRDSQLAVSSFARMLIDNASTVCGPNVEVDMDILSPAQTDHSIRPFKVWMKEGGTNSQRAVQSVSFDSHIPELLTAIQQFDEFADAETFISPVTGGDVTGVSGEALRTTGGASMIMGAAALPFRDIVRNFDRFTVSVITALVRWNQMFSPVADRLQGDVRPVAQGATSLMAKEVRGNALDQLAATLSEEERVFIDTKALLVERLRARDLPTADLLVDEQEVERRQQAAAEAQQRAQQQQDQMFQANLEDLSADAMKSLAQAQKNLDTADVAVFKAIVEAMKNGASPAELARIAGSARQSRATGAGAPAALGAGEPPVPGVGVPDQDFGNLQ